jgi:hypothetical protein
MRVMTAAAVVTCCGVRVGYGGVGVVSVRCELSADMMSVELYVRSSQSRASVVV